MRRTFGSNYKIIIVVVFLMKSLKIKEQLVKLQLWDTSGKEKFKSMISLYYRGTHVALIILDLNLNALFEALPS